MVLTLSTISAPYTIQMLDLATSSIIVRYFLADTEVLRKPALILLTYYQNPVLNAHDDDHHHLHLKFPVYPRYMNGFLALIAKFYGCALSTTCHHPPLSHHPSTLLTVVTSYFVCVIDLLKACLKSSSSL